MYLVETLEDIEKIPRDYLLATEIAVILKACPHTLRGQAHQCPAKLGFPVIVQGTRVKSPKIPFLKFMRGE